MIGYQLKYAVENYKEHLALGPSPITTVLMAEDLFNKWKQLQSLLSKHKQVIQVRNEIKLKKKKIKK